MALALALPAAASAQLLDPTLEQYAPSTQQIDKHVKGDGKGGDGGQDKQGGGGGTIDGVGDDGQAEQGEGAGAPGGGQAGGGETPTGEQGDSAVVPAGGQGGGGEPPAGEPGAGGTSTSAQGDGLDERVVASMPLTRFDLLAMALAAIALTGTAVVLRRLSRLPRVGD